MIAASAPNHALDEGLFTYLTLRRIFGGFRQSVARGSGQRLPENAQKIAAHDADDIIVAVVVRA